MFKSNQLTKMSTISTDLVQGIIHGKDAVVSTAQFSFYSTRFLCRVLYGTGKVLCKTGGFIYQQFTEQEDQSSTEVDHALYEESNNSGLMILCVRPESK